jgi:hypothetical protein
MVNITEEIRDRFEWKTWKNEVWLKSVINSLQENGKWGWIDFPTYSFIKKGDRLICCENGYKAISKIVSENFLLKNFYREN